MINSFVKKIKWCFWGIIFMFFSIDVTASKAIDGCLTITLPDGSSLDVCLHGDEFFHYATTIDGYVIAAKNDGYYYYSHVEADGIISFTSVRAHNPKDRDEKERAMLALRAKGIDSNVVVATRSLGKSIMTKGGEGSKISTSGKYKTLVILAEYQDVSFKVANPSDAFSAMLNDVGYSENGATGSAADYFRANSNNNFEPEFVVVGPVRLSKKRAYYGTNDKYGRDSHAREQVMEACRLAKEQCGVNFSMFDSNSDGVVDNVYVYYAGYDEAAGGPATAVWSHKGTLRFEENNVIDGLSFDSYACSAELKGNTGAQMTGIGTICHEFSHVLGLYDLYDVDGEKGGKSNGVYRKFSIMDGGNYNNEGRTPPYYNVVERTMLGWLEPTELVNSGEYSLASIENNEGYVLYSQSDKKEFFMIENRQQQGWDKYLPAHGMFVYHVDMTNQLVFGTSAADLWLSNCVNIYASHPCCYMVGANEVSGGVDCDYGLLPFPGDKNVTEFSRNTMGEAAKFWSGEWMNVGLNSIQENSGVISFNVENIVGRNIVGSVSTMEGHGLLGAEVLLLKIEDSGETSDYYMVKTDNKGDFLVENVVDGKYMLLVTQNGYYNYSCYCVVDGNNLNLQIQLTALLDNSYSMLKWHNDDIGGFANVADAFTAAVAWNSEQLQEYVGMNMVGVEAHMLGNDKCVLHIWENGEEIFSKEITQIPQGGRVYVDLLDEQILIMPENNLKVGFEFAANADVMLALDNGPMVNNGGLLKIGEWSTLKKHENIDQNWLISTVLVASEDALLVDVNQRDAGLRWPKVQDGAWKILYKKKGSSEFKEKNVNECRCLIADLQPDTEYLVQVLSKQNGEKYFERVFRTNKLTADYAAIAGVVGHYILGESISLKVKNVQVDIEKIEWRLDGRLVTTDKITPEIGEHELKATIVTKDGEVEEISRFFVVSKK